MERTEMLTDPQKSLLREVVPFSDDHGWVTLLRCPDGKRKPRRGEAFYAEVLLRRLLTAGVVECHFDSANQDSSGSDNPVDIPGDPWGDIAVSLVDDAVDYLIDCKKS